MLPIMLPMLLVPVAALALIAVLRGELGRWIAVISTFIGLALAIAILLLFEVTAPMVNGNYVLTESYPYIGSLGISLGFRVNIISLALLLMASVVLLATALAGNPEKERQKLSSALVALFQVSAIGLFTSANLFLFFVFWDIGIAALFFMINVLGSPNRRNASINFLIYEIFASALLLLGILLIYFYTPLHSFDLQYIAANASMIPTSVQSLIFLLLFVAFMTNMPIFPMHFWLPDAHTEASTQGSMLLSGVLTKFGGFGMLLMFTTLPIASNYAIYVAALAAISTFYSVFGLMRQTDVKRVVAYSTIVEMGIVLLGISSLTSFGTYGSTYAMLAHGLTVALMFLVVGSLKHVFGERDIKVLRGTVLNAKVTTYAFLFGTLAMVGFPLTTGFIADILLFIGAIQAFHLYGAVPLLALVLMGAYLYYIINRSMLSTKEHIEPVNFVGHEQSIGYALLIFFILTFGALPFILLNLVKL